MNNVKKEATYYIIFGLLTTAVNFVVYLVWTQSFGEDTYAMATTVAFVLAASFAYVTNKLFVFESKSWDFETLKKEVPPFFTARVISFLIDFCGLLYAGKVLHWDEKWIDAAGFRTSWLTLAKIVLQVVVVALNYVFSKFVIFKKENVSEET